MSLEVFCRLGMLPNKTVGAPIIHGAGVTGIHGIGVRTPSAAAVAAATIGFDGLLHIANVGILSIGTWSMMLAAGMLLVNTRFKGRTTRLVGAAPKLHCSMAPLQT